MSRVLRGIQILSVLVLCCLFAACGSSSSDSGSDTNTDPKDMNIDDVDVENCTDDVLDGYDGDWADVDVKLCGGTNTGGFQVCPGTKPSKFASFIFSATVGGQGFSNLNVKLRNTFSGSDLTQQIAREDGYPASVTIIREWNSSAPNTITTHTKAPQIGWTSDSRGLVGEANQLSLFPTYAKEILKCLGNADGLDKCSDKLTQTAETGTVGTMACTFFNFTDQPGIKICVPHGCDARSTLLPLKLVTTVGGKSTDTTWAGLKGDSSVTDDDFKQN